MRTFEIILLVTITILPFFKRSITKYLTPKQLLIVPGAIVLIQLLLEGIRWQMIPAYLVTIILLWRILMIDTSQKVRLSFLRIIGFLGIIILLFFGWVLPNALPVFTLPEPQGQYQVGTETIYLKTSIDETITKDPADKRELMYKIWYPSQDDVADKESDIYIDNGSRMGFATKYGLPPNALNYLDHVDTHVYPNIAVADGPFPVLLFSHGYGSKATGYYAILTELASQGYIIINMNHTHESLGATFPDGRITYFNYDFQREIADGSMDVVQPLINAFKDGLSYEERHPIVRESVINYFEGHIEDRWANDVIYTIDLLEEWNQQGPLNGKIDLDKIGVLGHSVGGGTAGKVAIKDSRIKAAANLDGIQWGNMIDTVYQIPYLYMSADWPAEHEDINSHVYINKSTNYFYETKLLKSGHPDFMDIPFMIPISSIAGTGEIDPYMGTEIINNVVTTFFDKHLKMDASANMKEVGSKYDLLEMVVHEGDSVKS